MVPFSPLSGDNYAKMCICFLKIILNAEFELKT